MTRPQALLRIDRAPVPHATACAIPTKAVTMGSVAETCISSKARVHARSILLAGSIYLVVSARIRTCLARLPDASVQHNYKMQLAASALDTRRRRGRRIALTATRGNLGEVGGAER